VCMLYVYIVEMLSMMENFRYLPFPTDSISGFWPWNGTEISVYELSELYSS
jgi:hypothetical protein